MTSQKPNVTIAIPTYNRADLLEKSLASAVAQDYDALDIVVIDNASTDHTQAVVNSFDDARIRYLRQSENVGLYRNFRTALRASTNPYTCILQDDDLLLPNFVGCSINALTKEPTAAFSVARVQAIDLEENELPLPEDPSPQGTMDGLDYLEGMVDGRNWVIHMSGVLMRTECVTQVGGYDNAHSGFQIDLSLYLRLAAAYDLIFMPDLLAKVRIHEGQDTEARFRTGDLTGPLVTLAERMDAVALLLQTERAQSLDYRMWLSKKLLYLGAQRSEISARLVPSLNISDAQVLAVAAEELVQILPVNAPFLLIDEESWRYELPNTLTPLPFPEQDGYYNGAPLDDAAAIHELERQIAAGVTYLAVAKPSLWWLDYYAGLRKFLASSADCLMDSSFLKVYKLRSYTRPEKFRTTSPKAEMEQNFSGVL